MNTLINNSTTTTQQHAKGSETQTFESEFQHTATTIKTEIAGLFTGDMTISKIVSRCQGAIQDKFEKFDFETKTACSDSEKLLKLGWEQAKQNGQWITAHDAYRLDTLEQGISEVGGYMCNPVNSKMIKVYRKTTLPKGTWMERKSQRLGSADLDVAKLHKRAEKELTKTCGQCLDKKMISSGTYIQNTSKFMATALENSSSDRSSSLSGDELKSDYQHSDYVNFETSNKKNPDQKDLAGIAEADNEEGGSSLPRNPRGISNGTERVLERTSGINMFERNFNSMQIHEEFESHGSQEIIHLETKVISNYNSTSIENMTFRNELRGTLQNASRNSVQDVLVDDFNSPTEHRSSRDSIPRDYRDGAMIYETENGPEKARLCELDSSTHLNTKFMIESAQKADREMNSLQADLERSSQKKAAAFEQEYISQKKTPSCDDLGVISHHERHSVTIEVCGKSVEDYQSEGLSYQSRTSRIQYEAAQVERDLQPIESSKTLKSRVE